MKKSHNLTKILSPYAEKKLWLALSPDRKQVVGAGKTPKKALEEGRKKVKEPILIQAIPDYSGLAP